MNTKDPKIKELEETIYKYKRTVYGIALTMLDNTVIIGAVFIGLMLKEREIARL